MAKARSLRRGAALLAILAIAACATPEPPPAPPPPPPPAPVIVAPPPPPPAPTGPPDTCSRAEYEALVGRNRSEIPVFVQPNRVRVACTTCPVTMDFNAQRLNIFFDETTGVIAEVRCG